MKLARNLMIGLAGAALLAAPAVAAPIQRGSDAAQEANGMEGGGWIFIIAAIAVVALAIVAFNKDDDNPTSP